MIRKSERRIPFGLAVNRMYQIYLFEIPWKWFGFVSWSLLGITFLWWFSTGFSMKWQFYGFMMAASIRMTVEARKVLYTKCILTLEEYSRLMIVFNLITWGGIAVLLECSPTLFPKNMGSFAALFFVTGILASQSVDFYIKSDYFLVITKRKRD